MGGWGGGSLHCLDPDYRRAIPRIDDVIKVKRNGEGEGREKDEGEI